MEDHPNLKEKPAMVGFLISGYTISFVKLYAGCGHCYFLEEFCTFNFPTEEELFCRDGLILFDKLYHARDIVEKTFEAVKKEEKE